MMMVIVVIKRSNLAYRSVTNESNVPGDAVNAFVYAKIAAHLGLFVLSEGEKSVHFWRLWNWCNFFQLKFTADLIL